MKRPEINPEVYGQLGFEMVPRQFKRDIKVFSTNGAGITRDPHAK